MKGVDPRILWGAKAIARRIDRSPDFVDRLARVEGTPIRRFNRQIFAMEDELIDYFRQQPPSSTPAAP